jgi:hypothetical protein
VWAQLDDGVELLTSELAALEISRTLLRAGVERDRMPYVVGQALRGVYLIDVTSTVLARAWSYGIRIGRTGDHDDRTGVRRPVASRARACRQRCGLPEPFGRRSATS